MDCCDCCSFLFVVHFSSFFPLSFLFLLDPKYRVSPPSPLKFSTTASPNRHHSWIPSFIVLVDINSLNTPLFWRNKFESNKRITSITFNFFFLTAALLPPHPLHNSWLFTPELLWLRNSRVFQNQLITLNFYSAFPAETFFLYNWGEEKRKGSFGCVSFNW